MDLTAWLSYVAMISALIAFPGPSSLLITLHGYQYGLKRSNFTISGNLLGSFVLMTLSALGLGIIITTSETMFSVVKYLGAVYLIYMGIKTWRKASNHGDSSENIKMDTYESSGTMFKHGFFTGVSNPKDLVFFAALFPVFINSTRPILEQLLVLMITWLVIDYVIKAIYATTGTRINKQFSNNSFVTVFNRITGGMFVLAGVALANSGK